MPVASPVPYTISITASGKELLVDSISVGKELHLAKYMGPRIDYIAIVLGCRSSCHGRCPLTDTHAKPSGG